MLQIQVKYAMGLVALTYLMGCSTRQVTEQTRADASEPIYCKQGDDCEAKWHRAIDFVGSHSGFRLNKVTDQFAQTTGPKGHSRIATTVRKQPLKDDLYRIAVEVDCGRNFVEKSFCNEDRVVQYVAELKQRVKNSLSLHRSVSQRRPRNDLRIEDIGPSGSTINDSEPDWNSGGRLPMAIIR